MYKLTGSGRPLWEWAWPAGPGLAVPGSAQSRQGPWGCCPQPCSDFVCLSVPSTSRATWRTDRDMGLMNAIGLQPRNPTTSVTLRAPATLALQLQNAETCRRSGRYRSRGRQLQVLVKVGAV